MLIPMLMNNFLSGQGPKKKRSFGGSSLGYEPYSPPEPEKPDIHEKRRREDDSLMLLII